MPKTKEPQPLYNSVFGIGSDLTSVHQNFSGKTRVHTHLDREITDPKVLQQAMQRQASAKAARVNTMAASRQTFNELALTLKEQFPAPLERPDRANNPFYNKGDKGYLPLASVHEFLGLQEQRTGVRREDAYGLLPPSLQSHYKVSTYRAYFNPRSRGFTFPAPIAIALWDVYAEIPGLHEVPPPATPSP